MVGIGGPCSCAHGPCLTQTMEMASGLVRHVSPQSLAQTQNLGLGVRVRESTHETGPSTGWSGDPTIRGEASLATES